MTVERGSCAFGYSIVCSREDMREIECWERQESSSKAMMELITRIPLHIDNWFTEFAKALKENNYTKALKALEPKYVTASKY